MCKISAIITTKNRRDLLQKAVESVLNQTYQDLECIVVDDASTDETRAYLKGIKDTRIKPVFITPEESKGGNYARNRGIQASNGEFLAFLDDDDEWFPTKLEKQLALFEDPEVGLVFCGHIDVYDYRNMMVKVTPADDQQGDLSQFVFKFIFCTTSMMMVRKSLMLQIGCFDENIRFWQEYDVCIRLCQITKVAFVKEPLMLLRHNISDKHRLTNKFDGWVQAVRYQNHKYKDLIADLPEQYKWDRKLMIYIDAAKRCENAGDRKRQHFYLKKIAEMTHLRIDYVRYFGNIGFFVWDKLRYRCLPVLEKITKKKRDAFIDSYDAYL